MKKVVHGCVFMVAAIVLVLAQPLGAQASGVSQGGDISRTQSTTMTIRGFDADVARRNGFEISVDDHGNQQSVAVSDPAKALMAAAAQGGHPEIGRLTYSCGSSWLNMARAGGASVYFNTGYRVYLSTFWHTWAVDIFSSHGGYSFDLGGGPSAPTWDDGGTINVGNSSGTHGNVRPGSYAVLTNGAICYSDSPSAGT